MKLYVLTCGLHWVEKAFIWHFGKQEDSGKQYTPEAFCLVSSQYYIDHPEAKIIYDLGLKLEDFSRLTGFPLRKNADGIEFTQGPDENPIAQLAKIGVKIDDIDYVVLSHLMVEHAGWLPAFAGKKAQIIVQYKEWEYANIGTYNPPGAWESAVEQFHSWMYWRHQYDIPGLNYKFIEGDYELVKDVIVLHGPGHTPGYQMMLARLPKTGTIVVSGCELRGMYYDIPINGTAPGIPHSFTWSAAMELRTFRRIREIVEKEKGQLFCGHDWEQFKTLKHVPEYYE